MASLSSKTPSSSGTTSYGATSYKTTTTTSSNRNSKTNRQKRLSQDRDNQAYRLSSWNTSQLNVHTQPTIINSNGASSKTKSSSKNMSKMNVSKYNSQTNHQHHSNNLLSKTSLFKPKVGLAQSVPNRSLVNILNPNSKNKAGMMGKRPPDKKVYKIVVIGDARVGKTSLIRQAKLQAQRTGNLFQPDSEQKEISGKLKVQSRLSSEIRNTDTLGRNSKKLQNSMKLENSMKMENSIKLENSRKLQNSIKTDQNSPSSAGSDIDDSALESASTPNLSPSNSSAKESLKVIKVTRNSINLSGSDEGIGSDDQPTSEVDHSSMISDSIATIPKSDNLTRLKMSRNSSCSAPSSILKNSNVSSSSSTASSKISSKMSLITSSKSDSLSSSSKTTASKVACDDALDQVKPTQSGCVDRYKFHIPIRISDETDEDVSELKAIAQLRESVNPNQTIGQKLQADLLEGELRAKQASQYKWFPAEVVDLLLGDVNEVRNPYIGQSRNGYQRKGHQRKTTVRKLSRKFSLVKRNKTFKTPMSKYAQDADAFILMFSLSDAKSLENVSSRWLFEINRLLTIKRPVKILVASHKELRDAESLIEQSIEDQKIKTWKWWQNDKKRDPSSRKIKNRRKKNSFDDDGESFSEDDDFGDENDEFGNIVPLKTGQKIAKQVNSIDYIEANPADGENCLKVFQRVISEIQMIESDPFYSMQTYQGPDENGFSRSALSQFKQSTKRMLKGVNSLPAYLRSKTQNSAIKHKLGNNQSSSATKLPSSKTLARSRSHRMREKRKCIMAKKKELERERKAKYRLRTRVNGEVYGGSVTALLGGKPPHRRGLLKSEEGEDGTGEGRQGDRITTTTRENASNSTSRRTLISGIQALISKQVRKERREGRRVR